MRKLLLFLMAAPLVPAQQQPNRMLPGIKPFVSVDAPVIALVHVRVIDGTGAPPADRYFRAITSLGAAIAEGKFASIAGLAPDEILMKYE